MTGAFAITPAQVTQLRAGNYYSNIHSGNFGAGEIRGQILPAAEPLTQVGVFRPSTGLWFTAGGPTTAWGTEGDIAVPGDYDGNGQRDAAVFRPSSGLWFVQGGPVVQFGTDGDIPVPADYDGDGTTDIAVFRPATGFWFVYGGATPQWGTSGDIPVPGDYNGNGSTEIAVFRPSSGLWFVSGAAGFTTVRGTAGDDALPLPYAISQAFF